MADLSELQKSLGVKPRAKNKKSNPKVKRRPWNLDFEMDVSSDDSNPEASKASKKADDSEKKRVAPKAKKTPTFKEGKNTDQDFLPPEKIINNLKKMLIFLCAILENEKTQKLTYKEMGMYLGFSSESARSACRRLLKFKSITVFESSFGASGGVVFTINQEVKKYFFDNYEKDIKFFSEYKNNYVKPRAENKKEAEINTAGNPYSMGNNANLPEDWREIDLSCLPGMTEGHLRDIYTLNLNSNRERNLTPKEVQDSLFNMAFDKKYNADMLAETFEKGAVHTVVGRLCNGMLYNSLTPDEYVTPEIENLRSYLKTKKEQKNKREEALGEIFEVEFEQWFNNLSDEDKSGFVDGREFSDLPPKVKTVRIREKSKETARKFFEIDFWPNRQKEIFSELGID